MTELVFNSNIKPENREVMERFLREWLWIVPTWCHKIFIELCMSEDNAAVRTSVTPEYRFANMTFYSVWLMCSAEEQAIHVIHDLLHTANCPYVNFTDDLINNLCQKEEAPKFNGYLLEQSRFHCEAMTQDLATAIYKRFKDLVRR